MVLWLVSHCETVNNREQYAEELGKYINVDIFGKCSKKTCDGENTRNCISNSSTDYKFYLAFENSNCYDYITEKYGFNYDLAQLLSLLYGSRFWFKLHYPLIMVVMGGGNYSRDAPPNSYIDTKDFKTPDTLAKYLNYLANNEVIYTMFLLFSIKFDYLI